LLGAIRMAIFSPLQSTFQGEITNLF
jgi:hypothetical protein